MPLKPAQLAPRVTHTGCAVGFELSSSRAKRAAESSLRFFFHQFNVGSRALKGRENSGCSPVGQNNRLELRALSLTAAMQGQRRAHMQWVKV